MRLGFSLPQIGPVASPQAIARVGKRAEELGYDSVWVLDRVLYPVNPQSKYPATPDGSLPEPYKRVFDPLGTLTFVAARTTRIGLGTSVLDMPYYNPVMLARQLTTLDVLSNGRLRVGFGQGWSKDEHDAAGTSMKTRAQRADEFLRVLKMIWTTDPVEFHGKYFHVPKSFIQPKPVQKPHPPIYLAAYAPNALKRAATLADGWQPVGVPLEKMKEMTTHMKSMAQEAGRNPADLKVVVRGNLSVTPQPLDKTRWMFTGNLEQIKNDIHAVREIGVEELILDPTFSSDSQTEEGFLNNMEQMRKLV
jgi:probable F420-dependent oxidoreductase